MQQGANHRWSACYKGMRQGGRCFRDGIEEAALQLSSMGLCSMGLCNTMSKLDAAIKQACVFGVTRNRGAAKVAASNLLPSQHCIPWPPSKCSAHLVQRC